MIYLLRFLEKETRSREDLEKEKKRLVSFALKKEYGLPPWAGEKTEEGVPFIKGKPDIHLSITHTKGLLGCALSTHPVGLDAEWRRARDPFVERKILGEEETSFLQLESEKDEAFFRYFTLKEAYGKAMGQGLSYDFKTTGFRFEDGKITSSLPNARFYFITVCEGYIISLCYLGEPGTQRRGETVTFILPEEG